jgi:hypothetical protein
MWEIPSNADAKEMEIVLLHREVNELSRENVKLKC